LVSRSVSYPCNLQGKEGGRELTVRTSRSASVGVVAEGVDVHAALGIGVVAGDVPGQGGGRRLRLLLEDDGAPDVGVTPENGN